MCQLDLSFEAEDSPESPELIEQSSSCTSSTIFEEAFDHRVFITGRAWLPCGNVSTWVATVSIVRAVAWCIGGSDRSRNRGPVRSVSRCYSWHGCR